MDLKKAVLECVDRGLSPLGENAKYVIYWHMRSSYKMTREEVFNKPEKFIEVLTKMFGSAGASLLERAIMREIKKTFDNVTAESFPEAVKELKARYKG
ncbi:MAG: NitrOD5 domain-containing protein [Candidatus Methanodesulfokora sp.]